MEQQLILKDGESFRYVVLDLYNYIIMHQSDFIEENCVYDYMKTVLLMTKLTEEVEQQRILMLLHHIDHQECTSKERYEWMMSLLNLMLYNKELWVFADRELYDISDSLKKIKVKNLDQYSEFIFDHPSQRDAKFLELQYPNQKH